MKERGLYLMKSVRNKLVSLAIIVILLSTGLVGTVNYMVVKGELDQVGRDSLKNGTLGILELINCTVRYSSSKWEINARRSSGKC